jgi:phosphatidate cytidylyltransferase
VRVLADAGVSGASSGPAWRDLRVRLISAGVLAPLGVACLLNGGWIFTGLVLLAMVGIGVEWAGLTRSALRSLPWLMLLAWPGACLLTMARIDWLTGLRVLLGGFLLGPLRGGGVVLIGLGGAALIWLRGMTGAGAASLLFVVLVVWASDSLAYLVGRALGGAKLAPRISPGKTWSGAAGGLLGAMVAGAIVASFTPSSDAGPFERIARGLLFGGLLGIAAQVGDLAESALKRRCGVKDSGRLIPGHGGLLDRLDGLFTAAPLAALLSLGCGYGQAFWQLDPLHLQPLDIGARHMPTGWVEGMIASAANGQDPARNKPE